MVYLLRQAAIVDPGGLHFVGVFRPEALAVWYVVTAVPLVDDVFHTVTPDQVGFVECVELFGLGQINLIDVTRRPALKQIESN